MELGFFSLECNGVTRNGLRDIKGLGIILSCLYIEAQGSVPVLLENLHGMSCSGVSSLWAGLYQWLVKVSWLGRLVLEFWWVELDFFSLECYELSSNGL